MEPPRLATAPPRLLWVTGRFGAGGKSDIRVVDAGVWDLSCNANSASDEELSGATAGSGEFVENAAPSRDGLTLDLGRQRLKHDETGSEVTDE